MPNEPLRIFDPFRLDAGNAQLWRGKEQISLRPKTFDVLRHLVDHAGELVTKAMLLDAVWPDVAVGDSMPATCVAELRRALGDDAKTPQFIETVHRRGYRFIAKVTAAEAEATRQPAHVTARPKAATGLEPLIVGREAELEQLHDWYGEMLGGRRRVIFVAGEAGIGKSTFVHAFLEAIALDGGVRAGGGQCLEQYGAGEPYMPMLEALSRLAREPDGAQVIEVLGRFAPTWLAQMPELLSREERVRLQGEVQGVTQQRMLREMTQALESLAAEAPLVLLLEDLHWSDFSTLELISAIARRSEPARLMLVGTYRPVEILASDNPLRTMKQELELHHYCEELRLRLLSEEHVVSYLTKRFNGNGSGRYETLAPVVHARTDGNPLFMVNVVDYLIGKAGLVVRAQEANRIEALIATGFDTPRSIREMIERNLERLKPEEQAVLEGASVAGPEFSAASVAAALERPQGEVEACCMQLSRREQFVSAQGPVTWPDGTIASGFRFNHALYQEVLYSRLAAGHQLRLHRLIALREEAGYGERAGEVATELAYHYSRANDKNKAIEYFRLAGERAVARGAFAEAEKAYRQALTMLKMLPESPGLEARELELTSALIKTLYVTKGYTAPEFVETAARAGALAEKSGNLAQLVLQGFSTWVTVSVWADYRSALLLADRLLEVAYRDGSPTSLGLGHSARLQMCFHYGELVGVEEQFARLSGFLEAAALRQFAGTIEFTVGFASLGAWLMGHPDSARERMAQVIASARDSKNPYDLASGRCMESFLYRFLNEPQRAEAAGREALAISEQHGFSFCRDFARTFIGWARAQLGSAGEGVALIQQGLRGLAEKGVRVMITDNLTRLAEAQALDGKAEEAIATIKEALEANPEEAVFVPNILRCRGELRLKIGETERAEVDFREAIAIAQKMSAKMFELRASVSLARLLCDTDRRDEARAALAEIYNRFTEGFDTADLIDAKALLDELN